MGVKPETRFATRVTRYFEQQGAVVFSVAGGTYQKSGWPDLQIYHPGWVGHLELKMLKGRLSPHQRLVIKRLRRVDFPAYVLRDCVNKLQVEDYDGNILCTTTFQTLLAHLQALA